MWKFNVLRNALILSGVALFAACTSGSNELELGAGELLELGSANEVGSTPSLFALNYSPLKLSEAVDPDELYRLILSLEKNGLQNLSGKTASIYLSNASWNPENQPENCELTHPDTLVCTFAPVTADPISDQPIAFTLPVYVTPYQELDFEASVVVTDNATGETTDNVNFSFSHIPKGDTSLALDSELAVELQRLFNIASGRLVRPIESRYLTLDECVDGGERVYIEDPNLSSFVIQPSVYRFEACSRSPVVLTGDVRSGGGRSYLLLELTNATMSYTVDGSSASDLQEVVQFTGDVSFFAANYEHQEDRLIGRIEHTSSSGEITVQTQYDTNCDGGEPTKIYHYDGYSADPSLTDLNSVSSFETADHLFNDTRNFVDFYFDLYNKGRAVITSDTGSTMHIVITNGPSPAVHIESTHGNSQSSWTIPWADEFRVRC